MKKLYTKLSQTINLSRISAFPKLVLIIAVLFSCSFSALAQPVVSITGSVPCAVSSTLTANSSIQPARIVWFENGVPISTVNATWKPIAATVAGTGTAGVGLTQLNGPYSIFQDAASNTFVADFLNNRIIEFPFGVTTGTVVAGSATGVAGSTLALLNGPTGVWVDATGNIYVTDQSNNRVLEFPTGSVAGTPGVVVAGGNGFGNATNQLAAPFGVAVDGTGNVFVADEQNNRIMKWTAGVGTVFAGTGAAGAALNQLNDPTGLFVDATGNLYVSDYNNNRILQFPPTSVSGTPGVVLAGGNGQGAGLNQLDHPTGIFLDGLNNLYVADANNNRVMQWPSGAITGIMVAGTGTAGTGNTQLNKPYSVWIDGNGLMSVADFNNNRVQQFTPNIVSTLVVTVPDNYTATIYTFTGANATAATTVTTPPYITSSPTNSTICEDNNTSFSVTAGGSTLTYQWQVSVGGGAFTNLTNTAPYSTVTTPTLTITNAPASLDGNVYQVVVSGSCAPPATSGSATLTVHTAAAITTNPTDENICEAGSTTFTVAATGTNVTYQWQVDNGGGFANITTGGGIYSGFTSTTLTVANVTNTMNGYKYRAIATSGTCPPPAASTAATLTITPLPVITLQPLNDIVCEGQNATFTIAATGSQLLYQWQVSTDGGLTFTDVINVTPFTGAQTPTLNLVTVPATMDGYIYRNQVSSNLGQCPKFTINATLTVHTLPAITTPPSNQIVCENGTTSFTVAATGTALTYQWQVNTGGGFLNVPAAAPYSGVNNATLTITGATASMNGYTYQVVVSGACTPSVTSTPPASLTVNILPTVSTPVDAIVCEGSNTSFSVTGGGTGITYQWQVSTNNGGTYTDLTNTSPYSTVTTATLNITAAAFGLNNNLYRAVVTGTCAPPAISAGAKITVRRLPNITTPPSAATVCEGSGTTFSVVATGSALTYQWQVSIGGGAFVNLTNTAPYSGVHAANLNISAVTAAMSGNLYQVIVSGSCTPPVSATAMLTVNTLPFVSNPTNATICAGGNTTFSVTGGGTGATYQWQVSTGGGAYANVPAAAPYSGVNTATLTITGGTTAMNGNTYQVIVSGACSPAVTSGAATLTVNSLPAITTPPSDAAVCEGSNTSFTVVASGTGITYQWQVNTGGGFANIPVGAPYTGINSATLAITAATAGMNGYTYQVVISGTCTPAVTSTPVATLTVNTLPTVTNPTNKTICAGTNTTFTVTGGGSGISYQWQVSTGGGAYTNLTNTPPYTGVHSAILTITGATAAMDGNTYQVIVTGTCAPPATSGAATLNVNTSPAITTVPSNATVCAGGNTSFTVAATGAGLGYQWQVNTGGGFVNVPVGAPYGGITSTTLTITGATNAMNNYTYQVVVSGTCTPAVTSTPVATLTVNALPVITTQPVNATVCAGNNTSFTVGASGAGISYQWQVNTGSGFANIPVGAPYGGITSTTLTITGATNGMNGYTYQAVATGTCAPPATSNIATLTVNIIPATPTVTPTPDSLCVGGTITLTASSATGGVTYGWTGPNTYVGAGNTININNAQTVNAGTYSAIATLNSCPSAPGTGSVVIIQLPTNPIAGSNSPVCAGGAINLTATSTYSGVGTGSIIYVWNGPGSPAYVDTAQNPTIPNAQSGNAGAYTVYSVVTVGTNSCPSALSVSTNVIVNPLPPSATLPSSNTAICQGQTLSITASAPVGLNYTWTGPNGFTANTQTATVPNVQLINAGVYSVLTQYPGTGCFSALPATDTVTVNLLPPAPTASNNGPKCVGDSLILTPSCASCTPGTTYSWTGPAGFTPTTSATAVIIPNVPANDNGVYTVYSVLKGCPSATPATTTVVINPIPVTPVASSNSPICSDNTLILTAVSSSFPTPAFNNTTGTYLWVDGLGNSYDSLKLTHQTDSIPNVQVTDAGTYQVYAVFTATGCKSSVPAILNIVVNPRPATPVTTSNSPICVGDNLHLMADCPACDPATATNVTYQWSGPNSFISTSQNPNIPAASAAAAGIYTTYAVLNGCLSQTPTTTTVVVNPIPATPIATSNSPICEGGTLDLHAAPTTPPTGVNYTWSGPNSFTATGSDPTKSGVAITDSGIYSVFAVSLGCSSAPGSVHVIINPSPVAPSATNITYCQNQPTVPLTAIGTNILWYLTPTGGTGNPIAPIPNDALPGVTTYYVTQTSATGCEGPRASLVVTVNQQSPMPFVAAPTITYCQGETPAILSATGQNLLWYTSQTGGTGSFVAPKPSTANAGNFIYYVSQNSNGCESQRAAITVIIRVKPQPPVALDVSYCQNQPAIPLTAIGQNVLWYTTPIGGVGSPIGPTPSTSIPDTITWYVTQTVNGCESDRAAQHVYIFYKPNVVILHSRNYVCQYDTMTFQYFGSALTNASYDWGLPVGASVVSGSAGGPLVVRFDTAGHLNLTLTVSNGSCKSDVTTYVVDVRPLPIATISSKHDVCQGDVVQVGLDNVTTGVQTYNWNFDGGTVISNVSDGGPYNIQWNQAGIHVVSLITVLNTCPASPAATDTVNVHVLPDASIGSVSAEGIICSGDSVRFVAGHPDPAYQFNWTPTQFFDHGNNVSNIYGNIDFTGEVFLTVTTEYGCIATDSVLITTQSCCGLELPNAFTPNNDGKNDLFRPITKGNHQVKIFRVQNRWGQTVFETTNEKLGWDGTYGGVPQDMDTYYWYIDYICTTTNLETHEQGEVYLIR